MWTNNKYLKVEAYNHNDCIVVEILCMGVRIELNEPFIGYSDNQLQVYLRMISEITLPHYYQKTFSLQPKHNAPITLHADNKEQAEMFAKEFMEAYRVEYTLVEIK